MSSIVTRIALASTMICFAQFAAAQGALTPPAGAPAPNMKSLDQIFDAVVAAQDLVTDTQTMVDDASRDANRTPIRAADMPFVITLPGSYYLAEGATIAQDAAAITISASNVTLDLNGHTLTGPGKAFNSANGAAGVRIDGGNVTVKNGRVAQWPAGGVVVFSAVRHVTVSRVSAIDSGAVGIGLDSHSRVEHCVVQGTAGTGINIGDRGVVHACDAIGNGSSIASAGIQVGNLSSVSDSRAFDNAGDGFGLKSDAILENCQAEGNASNGFLQPSEFHRATFRHCAAIGNSGDGIVVAQNAVIEGCQSMRNQGDGIWVRPQAISHTRIEGCTLIGNELMGIRASVSAQGSLTNCHVAGSFDAGVSVQSGWHIRGNTIMNSGVGTDVNNGAGIIVGSDCFVSENYCAYNDIGIATTSNANYFAQNTLRGNTTQKNLNGSLEGAGALANVQW